MKRTHLALLAVVLFIASAPQDPDRHKTATALQKEGLRFETQTPVDLDRAIKKYDKSVEKAEAAGNSDVAAQSLYWKARCHEKKDPPDIDAAQQAYGRIVNSFSDAKSGDAAAEKQKRKGVDVWLDLLYKKVIALREMVDDKSEKLAAIKAEAWDHGRCEPQR